jgi:histidine triad (HIT) family protein
VASECIFCGIVAGALPATIVAQDEHTVAFMDINPGRRGHALVVPRRHAQDLRDIDPDDLAEVFAAAQRLAGVMRERLGCERVHLWNSCGAAAGQVVPHFHVHVIPGDASDPELIPRPDSPPDTADIEQAAAALRG